MHPMGGLSSDDLDSLVLRLTSAGWNRDGVTLRLSGDAVDATGHEHLWAVGRPAQSLRCGTEVVNSDIVRSWVTDVLMLDPLHDAFGAWWDQEDERVVFDAVDLYEDTDEAVAEAEVRGEAAIYDLATDMERFI